jgi:HK97 family phage major capsid protein
MWLLLFAAGDSANTISAPNEFDVINAVATQVEIANGIPNAIFIHPRTVQALKAVKATDGTPLWRNYVDMLGEMTIAGMKVVSTTAVTAGEFIGGDLKAANVLFRETMNLRIGLDGTDWSENKKTALLESRLVQFVSANDVPVIVKGDFATAKTALEAVVTP